MTGINNTIALVGFVFLLSVEIKKYLKMSDEEKVQAALKAIKPILLKHMSEAEVKWDNYKKAGELKKSAVIQKVYDQFPVLKTYKNQDELIKMIETMIDEQLVEVNRIINEIPVKE